MSWSLLNFGPKSKHAFDWALAHFVRLADTIHLVLAVHSVQNQLVYDSALALMDKLAVEAFQSVLVRTKGRIVEGDAGKVICREAERIKPAAVVMGTRGRTLLQSTTNGPYYAFEFQALGQFTIFEMRYALDLGCQMKGSVSEYCFHNCKAAPVIIVPGKDAGEQSVI